MCTYIFLTHDSRGINFVVLTLVTPSPGGSNFQSSCPSSLRYVSRCPSAPYSPSKRTHIHQGFSIGVIGIPKGTFLTPVVIGQSFYTVHVKDTCRNPTYLFCGPWKEYRCERRKAASGGPAAASKSKQRLPSPLLCRP